MNFNNIFDRNIYRPELFPSVNASTNKINGTKFLY